jgi:hypothetical protein
MPTGANVQSNELLTAASIDYTKQLAAAHRYVGGSGFLPTAPASRRAFEYRSFSPSKYVRGNAAVNPHDGTKTALLNGTLESAIANEYRFGVPYVSADVEADGGDQNVTETRAMYEATRIVALDYEIALNTVLNTITANAGATAVWTNNSTSDIILDLQAAAASIGLGFSPNAMIVSLPAYRAMKNNTKFRQHVLGDRGGILRDEELSEALADILGSSQPVRVKVANAVYNSAGLTSANTYTEARAITGTVAYLMYLGMDQDGTDPSCIREFVVEKEEGVFVSDDSGDRARNATTVAKKLVRKPILQADTLGYRITGVVS